LLLAENSILECVKEELKAEFLVEANRFMILDESLPTTTPLFLGKFKIEVCVELFNEFIIDRPSVMK
jgi:hypothetical protein